MPEKKKISERISGRFILLAKLIELKTLLVDNGDFKLKAPLYATKERKNPKDWALVSFLKSKLTTEEKKEKITEAMRDLSITLPQDKGKYFYLRLPSMEARLIELIPSSTINEINQSGEIDVCKSKLLYLSKLLNQNKIFGVMAGHQDLECGKTGKFIFYDSFETKRSLSFFAKLNFSVKKGSEENTLIFELENLNPDSIDTSKAKIESRDIDLDMCIWIIKEVCGKKVKKTTENLLEISCTEIESVRITTEVEKFGFKITTQKILTNTFQFTIKITKLMNENTKTLSQILTETLNGAFVFLGKQKDREVCIQFHHVGDEKIKINTGYGTGREQRQETLRAVIEKIYKKHPDASIDKGRDETTATISIPGYKNRVIKKHDASKIKKDAKTEPIQTDGPRILIPLSDEQVQQVIQNAREQVIDLVIKDLEKYFLFVNKKNPMVPGLLAFPKSPFSDPENVKKKLKK